MLFFSADICLNIFFFFTKNKSSDLFALLGGHVFDRVQSCEALQVSNVYINT